MMQREKKRKCTECKWPFLKYHFATSNIKENVRVKCPDIHRKISVWLKALSLAINFSNRVYLAGKSTRKPKVQSSRFT